MTDATTAQPGVTAPPDLDGLLTAVSASVCGLLLCVGGGAGLALYLRRRALAATWSVLALPVPLAVLAALIAGVLSLSLLSALALLGTLGFCGGLVALSVNLRIEDRRAGADRESAAAARRGLLDSARARFAERRRSDVRFEETVPVGRTERGALVTIPRGTRASGSHALIPGATGTGKTTSLAALLTEYGLRSRFGVVVVEAKSDAALLGTARAVASARGAPFHLVSPEGPTGYDPLASGGVDERSERLVAAQEWGTGDADFYRQAASPFLRQVIEVLDAAQAPVTLARAAQHCDPDLLPDLALAAAPRELASEVKDASLALRADERRAIAGMRARLRNLASSEFASRWLDPQRAGRRTVDLRVAIARREVLYFRLDTDRTGNVGRAIAQMLLLDLGAAASAMMGEGVGTFVAVDEFGALEAPALERLFVRGRAAGFSVALGTQTVADLSVSGPAVRDRIGATVSAVVCHRLGGQQDAEWIGQLIGTAPAWETTIRTDRLGVSSAEGTRTRGHQFEVHPADLQRLEMGEAFVASLARSGSRRSARARVVPPWSRLGGLENDDQGALPGLGRRGVP